MLSVEEARQLDRLAFGASTASPAASASGARVSRARGFGLEFREFRRYEPGDDPRAIDWTIHARLRQLVVRVHRADAHLRVHLLVDVSGSMATGAPDKLTGARKIAALLSYVAVGRRDAVGVATFDRTVKQYIAPAAGRPQLLRIFDALATAAAGGQSAINHALANYGAAVHGPGLVVVISDFYQAGGSFEGLRYLLHRGLTPAVVQVVAPQELDPDVTGDVELVDIEDPLAPPVLVDPLIVAAYRERMAELTAELGEFCISHGLSCVRVESSFPFARLLRACRDASLLAGPG
jgi:uncharacterized protein (DUF58 family)